MNKPHAHIYSAEINKWIAGTLKLPTYLRPRSPHGARTFGDNYSRLITGQMPFLSANQQFQSSQSTVSNILSWFINWLLNEMTLHTLCWLCNASSQKKVITRMWADAQRDGRPAECSAVCSMLQSLSDTHYECRAVMLPRRETHWKLMGCPKPANRSQPLVSRSSPYCEDM